MEHQDQTERDRRARDIFLRAAEIHSSEAQAAYLEGACQRDASLRARVEALLDNHRQDSFLENAAVDPTQTLAMESPLTEGPGTKIGRYKLLQQIGEGGMGVVYLAEQEEPVRRRVALKIIKLGMDTRQVVARFEAERQALAMMDHPNIAKVLDGGTTETGRPYFVMELVQGVPIIEFCDKSKVPAKERLKLFVQVCQAVQSAHQKGIIHRDLKPSNILVTLHHGEPMPKVIDFGIAKATNQKLTEKTLFTQHATMIGTPAYMSPEQAEMTSMDVDTRTDIYSLGVLLYELLTGGTPFPEKRLRSLGYGEMQRVIVDEEPERPSTRLSTLEGEQKTVVARNRGEDLAALNTMLRGDLDWIVMKCLEKDRQRRYDTANGLAADIQRHLNNEPVTARPPSAAYRFQKAWKRNKVVYTAGLAVAAALAIGLLISVRQTLVATKAERGKSQALVAEKEQRIAAQAAQKEAEAARGQAVAQILETRRRAYAADINLAQHRIDEGNLGHALKLLDAHKPLEAGEVDLRGWEWRYLRDLCKSEAIRTLCVLTNRSILALHTSGDGRWLAIRAGTDRVLLWDLLKGMLAETFETPWFPRSAAFSPSSSLFACEWQGDATKELRGVRLWDLKNRRMVADLAATGETYVALAFSQDEKRLMTVDWDGRVRCWQVQTGEEIALSWREGLFDKPLRGPSADISADLELIAKGRSGGFQVLDVRAGRERWTIGTESPGWVSAVAFSPGITRLLATSGDQATDPIRLWEAATGRFITNLVGNQGVPLDLKFGPEGSWLTSASIDHTIRMWDLRNLPHVPPARVFRGHKQEVWALALLNDGRTLVSGAKDGEVCLWDIASDGRRPDHFKLSATNEHVTAWFSAAGHSLTILDTERDELRDWDGQQTSASRQLVGLRTRTHRVRVSRDGRWIASSGTNAIVQVWELPKHTLAAEIKTVSTNPFPLQFDSHAGRLAIIDGDDLVVWDLALKERVATRPLPSRRDSSEAPVLASDLSWAVVREEAETTGERGARFFIMDMTTGRKRPLGHIFGVNDVSISPADDLVAIPSVDGYVRIWRSDNCDEVALLRGFRNAAGKVAFSPDGSRLAVGTGGDGLISIWDVATWRELVELKTGGEFVTDLQFAPDGSALWAAVDYGAGRAFHLWRAPSWEELVAAEVVTPTNTKRP